MKFLVDMPLSPKLAAWLVAEGHDAVHASDIGMERAQDATILALGREQGRTIITADLDYPRLVALAQALAPSVILFRGGDWSEKDAVARMNSLLKSMSETDIAQSIIVIDRDRVRRRRLPV